MLAMDSKPNGAPHKPKNPRARQRSRRKTDSLNRKARGRGNSYFLKQHSKYYTPYQMSKYEEHMHSLQQRKLKGVGPEVYPIWIHQYKLAMCLIPKNAITMWKMVLLRMIAPMDDNRWWVFDKKIHQNKALKSRRLTPPSFRGPDIDTIYEEESNHFVVTIRDPLERALSGYLYFDWYFKEVQEFKEFPAYLFKMREKTKSINHHVREQHLFCDLDRAHSRYQEFAFSNISDRKRLLDSLGEGIWDEIGATGWHPAAHPQLAQTRKQFPDFDKGDISGWERAQSLLDYGAPSGHSVSANSKVLSYYSNVTLIAEIMRFYRRDYQLFDILTVPEWVCQIIAETVQTYAMSVIHELTSLLTEIEALTEDKRPSCYVHLKHCVETGEQACKLLGSFLS